MNPVLWDGMKALRQELLRLEQIVTDAAAHWVHVGTSNRRVHYALWERQRIVYLIACNASPALVTASFDIQRLTGQKPARMQHWFDGGAQRFSQSKLTVTFAPHQRQVFEFS